MKPRFLVSPFNRDCVFFGIARALELWFQIRNHILTARNYMELWMHMIKTPKGSRNISGWYNPDFWYYKPFYPFFVFHKWPVFPIEPSHLVHRQWPTSARPLLGGPRGGPMFFPPLVILIWFSINDLWYLEHGTMLTLLYWISQNQGDMDPGTQGALFKKGCFMVNPLRVMV